MIDALLATGLIVISAAPATPSPPSWSCAYVAERLPRVLSLLGHDAISAEQTRAARRRLGLADAVLTRASNLALARGLGATRLITVRCSDAGRSTTIDAQSFATDRPHAEAPLHIETSLSGLAEAVEELGRNLVGAAPLPPDALRKASAEALLRAGPTLASLSPAERARGLADAVVRMPTSLDLRLSAVESLLALRDYDRAIAMAAGAAHDAGFLSRAIQFQAGAALLEAGRYSEARDTFLALGRSQETAAVLNNLGVALFRLRDPEASRRFERASFFKDHRQSDISFNRSLALLFEGKPEQAIAFAEALLAQSADDARARLLRVWALRLLRREPERVVEWERLLAAAPSFAGLGVPDLARRLERIFVSERQPDRP